MNETEIKRPVWGPVCDLCDQRLEEPGSLLFGPPDTEGRCLKTHICVRCSRSTPVGVPVPEGFVVVPREPTEAMLRAGLGPFMGAHDPMFSANEPCGPIYRAMIAATPPVTPQVGAGDVDAQVEGAGR